MDREQIEKIINEYECMKKRAEKIWDIQEKYLDLYVNLVDVRFDFCNEDIEFETIEPGRCGYHDESHFYYAPLDLLLQEDDDEIHKYFKEKKREQDEQKRLKQERERALELERKEKYERKQLVELIKKYGIPELPDNNE